METVYNRLIKFYLIMAVTAAVSFTGIVCCSAQEPLKKNISLPMGTSKVLHTQQAISRVSIGTPQIADIRVVGEYQIYLTAKSSGLTNLMVWNKQNNVQSIYDIKVIPNLTQLKEELHRRFPKEENIEITTSNSNIVLSGSVSSTSKLGQIVELTELYAAEKGKVVNQMDVAGVQQVMLEVRVSEMSRGLMKKLGINFNYLKGNEFFINKLANLSTVSNLPSGGSPSLSITSTINALFRIQESNGATWTALIDALEETGCVTILAEPTLIALSGRSASFLAGGEIPIPKPSEDGLTIEYKQFGVSLNFQPTVLSDQAINLEVTPEVSNLDFSNAIQESGFTIPAFSTRRTSTVVQLADGQSFAVAGLIQDNINQSISKFPLLGDIPILGTLFRSTQFRKDKSELVIIVTPHLVKPLNMAKQTLPSDGYIRPSDFNLFLMGKEQGRLESLSQKGGMQGEFGYILPE